MRASREDHRRGGGNGQVGGGDRLETCIVVIATAEINYREACIRRHLWVTEKRDALRERMVEDRRVAAAARANAVASERRDWITYSVWRRTIGKREPFGFSSVPCDDDCAMEMAH